MSYQSPIEVIIGQLRMEQENNIFKAVQEYGVNVDKEQLIKALSYDRGQYKKGYDDGYDDGFDKGYDADKWISVKRDGLPKTDGTYLGYTLTGEIIFCKFSRLWEFEFPLITHWQPLPAPPTEKPYD